MFKVWIELKGPLKGSVLEKSETQMDQQSCFMDVKEFYEILN